MKNNISIRRRLKISFLFLAVVPLILFIVLLSWQSFAVQQEQAKKLQKEITVQVSRNITHFFHEQENKLSTFLREHYLPSMTPDQRVMVLSKFLSSSKDEMCGYIFKEISFVDADGREASRVSRHHFVTPSDLRDRSNSDEFRIPADKGISYFSPVYSDETTEGPLVKVSYPIKDIRTLELKGVLVVEIKLEAMRNVVSPIKVGAQGVAYITGHDGRVVVHPNPSIVLSGTVYDAPLQPSIVKGVSGEMSVVAAETIELHGLALNVVTEWPVADALGHWPRILYTIIGLLIVTLGGAVTLAIILIRQIVKPIESLADTAKRISQGEVCLKADLKRNDELGDLAQAFNAMTSRLVGTIGDLEDERNTVRNTLESLTHPFYVINANDYTIQLANSASNFGELTEESKCYKLTHHSDKPCSGTEHPCTIEMIKKVKKAVVLEHIHVVDNEQRTVEVHGYPVFDEFGEISQVIEYSIDITDKKMLEEQLQQSQKLESIGSLAGGVAHDFNNLLTPIVGYSELALLSLSKDDKLRVGIEAIHEAGTRAAALTRQLLAFSRKQVMEIKVVDLNKLINNMGTLLERLIGENIIMKLDLHTEAVNIEADTSQVEQILMNLAVNARDAMPSGGSLIFETDTVVLDEDYTRVHSEIKPGAYVVLSVSDTGHGLAPGVKEKIFDPFFTTKGIGEGTGLGLSTVYGIMKQLGGHIFVYSEQDVGTTFKIYFSRSGDESGELAEPMPIVMAHGTETVLVVDDEASVRHLVADTLRLYGYQVLEAICGEDAIGLSQSTDKDIDVLLTDVIMPGMNGSELAKALEAQRPKMKTLFMSGYTANIIVHQGALDSDISYISKPLIPNLLLQKIRKVIDQ